MKQKSAGKPYLALTKVLDDLKQTAVFWPVILLIAFAWSYLSIILIRANSYSRYPLSQLRWLILLVPVFYLLTAVGSSRLLLPRLASQSRSTKYKLLLLGLIISAIITWIIPVPLPEFSQFHTLKITSTGEKNSNSQGALIELHKLQFTNGVSIPLDKLVLSGDWQIKGEQLISNAAGLASTAELSGMMPDGVVLALRFKKDAGQAVVQWDDQSFPLDLYSDQNLTGSVSFVASPWPAASPWQKAFLILGYVLFFLGVFSIVFIGILLFQTHAFKPRLANFIIVLLYLLIFVVFLQIKQSYYLYNGERRFNDTPSYVSTAQYPITSLNFWAGERSFTLPLFYKLTGITKDNYYLIQNMRIVGNIQTWLSVVCWTLLGLALAWNMRRRWLGPLAFALILFFSLSLDISLWDRLMLSESLSFSLFALTIASWLFLEAMPVRWLRSWFGFIYLGLVVVISALYSFTRDSNVYFLILSAAFYGLMLLLKKTRPETRRYTLAYIVAIVVLFFVQNASFNIGERWRPHIYDNLAERVVRDPQALAYYQASGMPITNTLLSIANMARPEYTLLFANAPELQPLRDWVDQKGESTYLRFMLTHPAYVLLKPIPQIGKMLNGSSLEYRWPRYPYQPVPPRITHLDEQLYPRSTAVILIVSLLVILGGALYLANLDTQHPAWLVVLLLFFTIIPELFIYWNGNPLEIERHAIQLAIQLRLAGWMALALLVDRLAIAAG